jgi:hypothetical protein
MTVDSLCLDANTGAGPLLLSSLPAMPIYTF